MTARGGLRVIHVFPFSARVPGGHTNAILAMLESQLHHGMDVIGLSPRGPDLPTDRANRIEHLPIYETDFDAPDFCAKALGHAAPDKPTVFHFTGITRPFERLARHLRVVGIPYVFTSQGQLHFRSLSAWLKKCVYLNFISDFVRNAAGLHILTRREATRSVWLLPGFGRPVLVHPNLVRVADPALVTAVPREQIDVPPNAFLFGYMGRLDVVCKGLDCLLKAFAPMAAADNCHLVLLGPDWNGGERTLRRLAGRLNCLSHLHFLGPQFGEAKWRILKVMNAFVSPSRWECFSSAQAEAIGFGLPTILSNRTNAAPDLVAKQAALAPSITPPALRAAMRRVLYDAGLRRVLSERGRQWVAEHCSIPAAGARFEEFYLKILGRR